ncbi:unnamed protein product [Symbiodinium natans]|uniref:JmjC domain-containing protein n=1 Tax=Symbiodinium natans TaxID=878477 RepID=A0A812J4E5_9DINO|nr:unnamed protein product [Symbiodinium natans]
MGKSCGSSPLPTQNWILLLGSPVALLDPVHAHGLQLKRIVDSLGARSCNPASTSEDARACASTAERSSGLRGLVQCLQEPGTALYLPTMWLHATLNVGDAVAFALQGNMFAGAHEVDMPEQLARGSAESLSYNLIFCLNENRMDEALTLARRMIEVAPRDLRPHFYVAEILGISGAGAEAVEQMEKAVEVALALAAEEPPAPKELVAVWLLRIAYAFCGPLESIPRGAEIVAQALEYDANALVGHQIGNILEECSNVAQEMAEEMEP